MGWCRPRKAWIFAAPGPKPNHLFGLTAFERHLLRQSSVNDARASIAPPLEGTPFIPTARDLQLRLLTHLERTILELPPAENEAYVMQHFYLAAVTQALTNACSAFKSITVKTHSRERPDLPTRALFCRPVSLSGGEASSVALVCGPRRLVRHPGLYLWLRHRWRLEGPLYACTSARHPLGRVDGLHAGARLD